MQFGDVRHTSQRISEGVRGERMVWHVTESHLPWLVDMEEWKGTVIIFAITATAEGSRLTVIHVGLAPGGECYAQYGKGRDFFIGTSLFKLHT